jgi:hypothetical protein
MGAVLDISGKAAGVGKVCMLFLSIPSFVLFQCQHLYLF